LSATTCPKRARRSWRKRTISGEGAKPFVHYHFVSEAGQFGSLDEHENQVDDAIDEIIDSSKIRIGGGDPGGVVFDYEIQGDTLVLSPVLTRAMKERAFGAPARFHGRGVAISVAYPGEVWKRVSCDSWC
jgi:hypothetical protein